MPALGVVEVLLQEIYLISHRAKKRFKEHLLFDLAHLKKMSVKRESRTLVKSPCLLYCI